LHSETRIAPEATCSVAACGKEIVATAVICPHCGTPVKDQAAAGLSSGLRTAGWVCAFLLPFVGIIIGIIALTKKDVGSGIAMIVVSLVMMGVWAAIL
jgi:hypothetical protein